MSYSNNPFSPPIQYPAYTSSSDVTTAAYYLPPVKLEHSSQYYPCRSAIARVLTAVYAALMSGYHYRVTTQAYSPATDSSSYVTGEHTGLFYDTTQQQQQLIGGQQIVSSSGPGILPTSHAGMMDQHLSLAPSGTRASPATVSYLLGYHDMLMINTHVNIDNNCYSRYSGC